MEIRPEIPSDEKAIAELITAAFLEAEHSGGNEARIVDALRKSGSLSVSFVATENGKIVGHVAFSPVTIDDRGDGWFGLGPVAVVPDRQGEGVGSAADIDAGMVHGLNYPRGPLSWADAIGIDHVLSVLIALGEERREERYRPAPAITRLVWSGRLGRTTGAGFFEYDDA